MKAAIAHPMPQQYYLICLMFSYPATARLVSVLVSKKGLHSSLVLIDKE